VGKEKERRTAGDVPLGGKSELVWRKKGEGVEVQEQNKTRKGGV